MATTSTDKKVGDYEIDIDPDKALGEGSYGKVFVGRHASSGKDIAAKLIEWEKDLVTKEMDREAEMMTKIPPHPNVLKIIEYLKRDVWKGIKKKKLYTQGWLILPLCTVGNLAEYAEEKALSVLQKVDLTLQGSLGLQHLHWQTPAIIHHDIKLVNLLITGSEDHPVVKVADFGISKFFAHSGEFSLTKRTREGTEWYLAPELFRLVTNNRAEYNKAIDVFAMGVSGLSVLVARHGYTVRTYTVEVGNEKKGLGRHIYEEKITDVAALIRKAGESEEVKEFKSIIASMLARDAHARPTIDDVVRWLTELCCNLRLESRMNTVWPPAKLPVKAEIAGLSQPKMQAGGLNPGSLGKMMEQLTVQEENEEADNVENEKVEKSDLVVAVDVQFTRKVFLFEGLSWEECGVVPEMYPKHGVCICYVLDGFVLIGGLVDGSALANRRPSISCHHFSVITMQWKKLMDMKTPRALVSATEMTSLKLLVVGGMTTGSVSDKSAVCEVLDIKLGTWSSAASLPRPMAEPLVATAADHTYVLEQCVFDGAGLLEYDPTSDTFTQKTPLPDYVTSTSLASIAGVLDKIYLFLNLWNTNIGQPNPEKRCNVTLEFNPATEQWSRLAPPITSLCSRKARFTIIHQEKILLCGGIGRDPIVHSGFLSHPPLSEMIEFDPKTGEWKEFYTSLPFSYDYFTLRGD